MTGHVDSSIDGAAPYFVKVNEALKRLGDAGTNVQSALRDASDTLQRTSGGKHGAARIAEIEAICNKMAISINRFASAISSELPAFAINFRQANSILTASITDCKPELLEAARTAAMKHIISLVPITGSMARIRGELLLVVEAIKTVPPATQSLRTSLLSAISAVNDLSNNFAVQIQTANDTAIALRSFAEDKR